MTAVADEADREQVTKRSVSQYKEWMRCPYSYYLHRVLGVWERPAAWLPQGNAVHEAAEAHERSGRTMAVAEAQDIFRESYARHTNNLLDDTPNANFWFASGPYRGEADIERRYKLGLEQTERYVRYYEDTAPNEVIWTTPDGTPAIELPFQVDLGGVPVRGYIDAVIRHPKHGVIVRDNKTGKQPGDDFQLAVYAIAIWLMYGQEISTGDYWMGQRGRPTKPYTLDKWGTEALSEEFAKLDEGIRAENYEPAPDPDKCWFCPVNASCDFSAV